VIASSDSKQIIIDSNEVAETIKKQYLNDLAKLISTDSNLIALVTKRLESNVISHSENDNNVITDGSNGENNVEDEPENLKRKSIRKLSGYITPENIKKTSILKSESSIVEARDDDFNKEITR
jgi:hypothetical protein